MSAAPDPAARRAVLTLFVGRAGDRNARAMAGTDVLGRILADRLGVAPTRVGTPAPPLRDRHPGAGWRDELAAAHDDLVALATALDGALDPARGVGGVPVTVLGRCAAALATLPVVARHRPDACVVWFDAHGDANLPAESATGYLGGLVLTGAAGLWDTGLGAGLALSDVILVGARDLDAAERARVAAGAPRHVLPGPALPARLAVAVGGRPAYVHLDCDVLAPGLVPTEYAVPGGLTGAELRAACAVLARGDVVGVELAEFEAAPVGAAQLGSRRAGGAGEAAQGAARLLDCLAPLLASCRGAPVGAG